MIPSEPTSDPPRVVPRSFPSRWLRRWAGRIVLGLVLVLVVGSVVNARFLAPVPAWAHGVERGEVVVEVFGRGTIESEREVDLGFDLVGRLSDVLVEEGSRVSLGQELARLYPEQVRADLQVAATGVGAARASLGRLAAEESRARAALEAAERDEERARMLSARGSVPLQELDRSQDAVRLARAELDRVLAQRGEATRGIEVASSGAEQRRVTVLRATLLAPFDGLVTRRLREPGDTVTVGTTVLRVVDTERVYVSAWIDETLLGTVREGQAARIELPARGQVVPGRVTSVGWEADRQTHELLADVTPSRPLGRIAIGQRADVWVETERKQGVVRVPIEFIERDGPHAVCSVGVNGRVEKRRVVLGAVGTHAEVREGLAEGETVLRADAPGRTLPAGRRWRPL